MTRTATTSTRTVAGVILVLWARVALASEGDIDCGPVPLKCKNNAICVEDSPDFESHRLPDGSLLDIHSEDAQVHCACHPGWTGVACDVEFRSCDGSEHKCYHGGECVLGLIDMYDNDQFYCNCDDAVDEDGARYVGKYCEQKAMSLCVPGDETRFCLNDGICNEDLNAENPCICMDGFKGPHCEYKEASVPDCYLDCQNGGHCVLGTPSPESLDEYAAFWDIVQKADEIKQYCRCPPGFYGQFCEVKSAPCGDDRCFYGSQCFSNEVNGKTLHHCDCRFSNTGTASYAGRFCQYEANEYCNKGGTTLNGHLFCVNGGQCQEDVYQGCACPTGYRGFSCEYFVKEDLPADHPLHNSTTPFDAVEDTTCTLDCNGRGQCRDGAKDIDDQVVGEAVHLGGGQMGLASENFEHCVCEHGWIGLECEHEAVECGGGEYHCFHGSTCFTEGNDKKCDCSTASSVQLGTSTFGGDQCEHPATDICFKTAGDGRPSQGLSFCVNHGTCKSKIDIGQPHPGCDCDETKWTGPHCEIKVAPPPTAAPVTLASETSEASNNSDNKTVFEAAMIIVLLFVVLTFVGFSFAQFLRASRGRNKALDQTSLQLRERSAFGYRDEPDTNLHSRSLLSDVERVKTTMSSRDPFASHLVAPPAPAQSSFKDDGGPQVYLGPPKDEDGHVLHSVEIL